MYQSFHQKNKNIKQLCSLRNVPCEPNHKDHVTLKTGVMAAK